MFMGHYSAALALKRVEKKTSLGWLFLAVEFFDALFFLLILLGVERLNIVKYYTPSTHFELEFFPYSHGLLSSLVWAIFAFILVTLIPTKQDTNKKKIGLVIGIAVFSHWFLDLIVQPPDLPLLGDNSLKVGLGLWKNAYLTFGVESILLLIGLWIYLRGTGGVTAIGKYGMAIFTIFLMIVNAVVLFGPPIESTTFMALLTLGMYVIFSGFAFWLDKKRS